MGGEHLHWALWLLPVVFFVGLGAWLARRVAALGRARAGRRHQQAGEASERAAARWLAECGFEVLEHQPTAVYALDVEGEPRPVRISADLRVHDGREEWVVEVKTGERGHRVGFRGTRRQLLEYQLAFGTRGVLLVDPVRGQLQRVRFPFAEPASTGRTSALWAWGLVGTTLVLAWALLR